MPLQPHEERVVKELDDLQEKLQALTNFISTEMFKQIPKIDQSLLKSQLRAMKDYSAILTARITLFNNNSVMIKLRDVPDGMKFFLGRNDLKYKRIEACSTGQRVKVKPVGHSIGLVPTMETTLHEMCLVRICKGE